MRRLLIASATVAVCLLIVGIVILRPDNSSSTSLPRSFINNTSFTPYFYNKTIPAGFILDSDSINYNAGILFIRLVNKDQKSVILTQQAPPPHLLDSKVQGNENIDGAPGSAALTFKEGRTTGTLITQDKTMVIITSTDDVESSTIKDLIRLLKPMR